MLQFHIYYIYKIKWSNGDSPTISIFNMNDADVYWATIYSLPDIPAWLL